MESRLCSSWNYWVSFVIFLFSEKIIRIIALKLKYIYQCLESILWSNIFGWAILLFLISYSVLVFIFVLFADVTVRNHYLELLSKGNGVTPHEHYLLYPNQGASVWVKMASTLSNDACSRPECMLNIGSSVPNALLWIKILNKSFPKQNKNKN